MQALIALITFEGPAIQLGAGQGPDLTRYFAVLGILLAAVLGMAFGFKKLFSGALRAKAARRHLAVVDLLPLGGKQRLAVVRCYDRTFALGLGDKEVALIAEIDSVNTDGRGLRLPDAAERAEFARALESAGRDESARTRASASDRSGHVAGREARERMEHVDTLAGCADGARKRSGAERVGTATGDAATSAAAPTIGRRIRELLGTRGVLG